jgi:hypothetical protein
MECFEEHVILQLIYKNHRILLDSFDQVQIDEIQHRTKNEHKLRIKIEQHTLLFTSSNDNISRSKKTERIQRCSLTQINKQLKTVCCLNCSVL